MLVINSLSFGRKKIVRRRSPSFAYGMHITDHRCDSLSACSAPSSKKQAGSDSHIQLHIKDRLARSQSSVNKELFPSKTPLSPRIVLNVLDDVFVYIMSILSKVYRFSLCQKFVKISSNHKVAIIQDDE